MPTHPRRKPRSRGDLSAGPRRGSLKGALGLLVALMLGLLLWQLQQEFQQQEDGLRQRSLAYSTQLAGHLGLAMKLKAEAGKVYLEQYAPEPPSADKLAGLLGHLHEIYPALHSLAWFDAQGRILADSAPAADESALLAQLLSHKDASYHYAYGPRENGLIYLILGKPNDQSGGWLLRLQLSALNNWLPAIREQQPWLLEDQRSGQVILRQTEANTDTALNSSPLSDSEHAQSILQTGLSSSDWQLHALFDEARVRADLLPLQAGKLLLFILCATLALLALFGLLREQRSLRESHDLSRRSLEDAIGALGAIDERVLVTQADGLITYLNPRAEQMFGLTSAAASTRHLLNLLPALAPWLENSRRGDSDPVEILQNGQKRLYTVTCHVLASSGAKASGQAWVLRDVTE